MDQSRLLCRLVLLFALVAPVASAQTDPDDTFWDPRFAGPGVDGRVNASVSTPRGLIVGGLFTSVDGVRAHGVAILQESPRRWTPLGEGVDGEVFALALVGDYLYVGGSFSRVGGVQARNIARWSFATSTWEQIVDRGNNGVDSAVRALTLYTGVLAVGGDFRQAGPELSIGLAFLDTSTLQFTSTDSLSVDNAETATVHAIEELDGALYVGGRFNSVGSVIARNIAQWDGSAWRGLGMGPENGVDGRVRDLMADGENMMVAGEFLRAGVREAVGLAEWTTATDSWRQLVVPTQGLRGSAWAVARFDGDLIVGGPITGAGFTDVKGAIGLRGGSWVVLRGDLEGSVATLSVHNGALFAAGEFSGAAGVSLFSMAIWNGDVWSAVAMDAGGAGPTGRVFSLAIDGPMLYVGGDFLAAGGTSVGRIARWNGATAQWDTLGRGLDGPVHAIVVGRGGIWVGGRFNAAGEETASNVARYTTSTGLWRSLGNGLDEGVTGTVRALALFDSTLYVGGDFTIRRGSLDIENLAAYNTTTGEWSAPGASPDRPVNALAVAGGRLVAGGEFTVIGDVSAQHIAQYNPRNGLWEPLGSGTSGLVRSLAASGTSVYVGGDFATAGVLSAPLIARWIVDPGYWDRLGEGLEGTTEAGVFGLAVGGGGVWATGLFDRTGGAAMHNVARWDTLGRTWERLGSGVVRGSAPPGRTVAASDQDVYVGGGFADAGNRFTPFLARWTRATASVGFSLDALPDWMRFVRTTDGVMVRTRDGREVEVQVVDLLGRVLRRVSGQDGTITIPMSTLATGAFLLVVRSHGRTATARMVVTAD